MSQADANLLNYLKSAELFERVADAAIDAAWGEDAVEVQQSSYLRTAAAALAEATRQQALTGQALARDQVRVAGLHEGLEGRTVRITAPDLDYQAGRDFLVLGVEVDEDAHVTVLDGLTVL